MADLKFIARKFIARRFIARRFTPRNFIPGYFWRIGVVVVTLLAQLLPIVPHSVSAQAASCGEATLRSASMAAAAGVADDQQVEIPQDRLDLALYMANWRYKLTDSAMVESLVLGLFLANSDKLPDLDILPTFESYMQLYGPVLDTLVDIQDTDQHDWIVHTMLNLALDNPEIAPLVPYVWKDLGQYADAEFTTDADFKIGRSAQRYNLTDQLLMRSSDIMAKVYACAKEIPAVAEAHDHFNSHNLISSIIDSYDKIIADNPDLPVPLALLDNIGDDGTLTVSLNDLKALSETEFEKINASIDSIQESLVEIDKQQDVILDYIKDQELKAKWQEVMKKKAAEQQRILDGIKTSITVLSSLIGHFDPELGKQVNVVGNASLQIGVALNNWLKATAGLKGFDKITSFSTLVMTGNVIGAVINIVSLFGDKEPTPEELILAEIGKLRQQVEQLRQEMHSRFDRIDQELNVIYSSMHDRFNQIDIQLGKINGNVFEVQHALLAIDLKLSRIERTNYEFLEGLGRRPLLEAINGGLGYAERTGSSMPYQPDFVGFENVLHSWATVHSFDPLNAGPVQRDYSDAQVVAELTNYPLDSNINYLNGWLAVHNVQTIAGKRLASPRDWLFASRAYAQLGLEWPEHMSRINAERQAEMDQIGLDLEEAMHNLSTVQTPAGPVGNTLLYTTVMTYYENKLETLDASIQGLENDFMAELHSNVRPGFPFELHGGVTQTVTYATSGFTKLNYGSPVFTLPPPSNLPIPNYNEYNLADYFLLFGSERSNLTLDADFVFPENAAGANAAGPNDNPVPQIPPPPTCPPTCPSITVDLMITVTASYSDVAILNMKMNAGRLTVQATTDATEYTVSNWGTLKPRFEVEASEVAPPPEVAQQRVALLNEVTTKVHDRLGRFQQSLYGHIFNELTIGSLRTQSAELRGGKALLDSFVILGLPRALAKDEFFHAMLFGNQQLVDDSEVIQSFAISATLPITEVNVLVNPRLVIKQSAGERRIAFAEMLMQYLDGITAGTHVEGPDYITNTRSVLKLTMRIARVAALTPEGGTTVRGVIYDDKNGDGDQDAGEAGVTGATVTLTGGDASASANAASTSAAFVRTTTTDAAGVYTFTGVPAGQYSIRVDLPNSQGSFTLPALTVSGTGTVVVPATPMQTKNTIFMPALEKG